MFGLCGKLFFISSLLLAVFIGYKINSLFEDGPVPVLDRDFWWGVGAKRAVDTSIRSFKIDVPTEVIDDLHVRLDRFLKKPVTPPLENIAFEYGFNTDHLKEVIKYWREKYNWQERQKFFNQFPHFKTNVNGLDLHFLRASPAKNSGKRVLPLLLIHGWPGSVREFYDILPILTTPRDGVDFVFDVVAPSLPGYGWSEGAARPGMGPAQMAVIMNNLMKRIGFEKYYVQGGDWGAIIGKHIATLYPSNVLGFHSNMCSVNSGAGHLLSAVGSFCPSLIIAEHEKELTSLYFPMSKTFFKIMEETGYFHIQATKPDTIGTVLGDTPAGLATYILEKFVVWTNKDFKKLQDGGLTRRYTIDSLLDNVMVYWVTNSITTSQRLYSEAFTFKQMGLKLDEAPIIVPTACARFHHDLGWQPEKILRLKFKNLVQVTDYPDGGHFAAWEHPKVLASDLDQAIVKFEASRLSSKSS